MWGFNHYFKRAHFSASLGFALFYSDYPHGSSLLQRDATSSARNKGKLIPVPYGCHLP